MNRDHILISVAGDQWSNQQQVKEAVAQKSGQDSLLFTLNGEGPSLHALGIADALLEYSSSIGIDSQKIWIDQWHNPVEQVPFQRINRTLISHFFWMSDDYRHIKPEPVASPQAMALFLGRLSVARSVMLYDVCTLYPDHFLVSLMRQTDPSPVITAKLQDGPEFDSWMRLMNHPDTNQIYREQWCRFWNNCDIPSITNHEVRDQYVPGSTTNRDLVKHYGSFHIELVAETYCAGDTFFPTEKTIRPLSQGKPMLVFGPKHFLKRLRDLGFQTWHDIWDESYDELSGADRWLAMIPVLGRIIANQLWQHRLIKPKADLNLAVLEYLIQTHRPG
jgi:hypothetical protein